ncbi:MAG: NAD(P)H-binding protein [Bacteroidota bacterium]
MKIIVTGATGLVGAEVVRQAILDQDIEEITAIVRKPLNMEHAKLKVIIHQDYLDYSHLKDVFKANDACFWCLGISQSQVSKQQYEVITYDYTVAAAKEMAASNPNMQFVFLSGEGADNTEKTKVLFGRIKGKAENALAKIPLKKLYVARPAGIRPIHKNPTTALVNKLAIPFYPLIELITPNFVINSVQLAKAMIRIVKTGYDQRVFENVELKKIGSDK